jgi:hypothetical protein
MSYQHSRTTRLVLRSLVPVICPPEAAPLADAIVDHMALTFTATAPIIQRAFAAGMIAYDAGALPRYLRFAHALPPDKAARYYQTWEHGPTPLHTQLAKVLNQLMSLSCYEQPEMTERIGYRPAAWIAEKTKQRLTVFADDIRKQDAQILAPDPLRPRSKREVA